MLYNPGLCKVVFTVPLILGSVSDVTLSYVVTNDAVIRSNSKSEQ